MPSDKRSDHQFNHIVDDDGNMLGDCSCERWSSRSPYFSEVVDDWGAHVWRVAQFAAIYSPDQEEKTDNLVNQIATQGVKTPRAVREMLAALKDLESKKRTEEGSDLRETIKQIGEAKKVVREEVGAWHGTGTIMYQNSKGQVSFTPDDSLPEGKMTFAFDPVEPRKESPLPIPKLGAPLIRRFEKKEEISPARIYQCQSGLMVTDEEEGGGGPLRCELSRHDRHAIHEARRVEYGRLYRWNNNTPNSARLSVHYVYKKAQRCPDQRIYGPSVIRCQLAKGHRTPMHRWDVVEGLSGTPVVTWTDDIITRIRCSVMLDTDSPQRHARCGLIERHTGAHVSRRLPDTMGGGHLRKNPATGVVTHFTHT